MNLANNHRPGNEEVSSRSRSLAIDFLRGMACLWAITFHAWGAGLLSITSQEPMFRCYADALMRIVAAGHLVAPLFIVLSGYCLFRPMLNEDGSVKPVDWKAFFARRVRRILPAYYAAFVLCSIGLVGFRYLHLSVPGWESTVWYDLPLHLLLLHNLTRETSATINGCFWSLAAAAQLYLLMPLLSLLVRKLGMRTVVLGALAISVTWRRAAMGVIGESDDWVGNYLIYNALPGLLFTFVAGMAAAWINTRGSIVAGRAATAALLWLAPATLVVTFSLGGELSPLTAPLWAIVFASVIVLLDGREHLLPGRIAHGIGAIGTFSYSIYLTHLPILWLVSRFAPSLHHHSLLFLFAGLPASIGFGYLFHLLFERPFLRRASTRTELRLQSDLVAASDRLQGARAA